MKSDKFAAMKEGDVNKLAIDWFLWDEVINCKIVDLGLFPTGTICAYFDLLLSMFVLFLSGTHPLLIINLSWDSHNSYPVRFFSTSKTTSFWRHNLNIRTRLFYKKPSEEPSSKSLLFWAQKRHFLIPKVSYFVKIL